MLRDRFTAHKSESDLPWATAFVWQLRTLTELGVADKMFDISDGHGRELASFQWRLGLVSYVVTLTRLKLTPVQLLLVSTYAISAGKNLPLYAFTCSVPSTKLNMSNIARFTTRNSYASWSHRQSRTPSYRHLPGRELILSYSSCTRVWGFQPLLCVD